MGHCRVKSFIEHILSTPEVFIGYTNTNIINGLSEGLRTILLDGLLNCEDACYGIQDPYIEVIIDGNTISFEHKDTFPLNIDDDSYVPEMIFGSIPMAPYKKGRDPSGMGIKLVNIFSTQFRVQIGNSQEHKLYDQTWQNNCQIKHEPIITNYDGDDFIKISFELDFERFGFSSLTPEMIDVLYTYCQTLDKRIELRGYFVDEMVKEPVSM
jgi:DNA gyrase/topoisomerase IV subunit B